MSSEPSIIFLDLATKQSFKVEITDDKLEVRTAKNGRQAFVHPAPTERANLCWKFASAEQVKQYSEVRAAA
jgi:hypothetical protein